MATAMLVGLFLYVCVLLTSSLSLCLLLPPSPNCALQEALGALAAAIKSFDGGCLLISHNNEFTSTCCTETWRVADGQVVREAPQTTH
jgi:hypothetical protein